MASKVRSGIRMGLLLNSVKSLVVVMKMQKLGLLVPVYECVGQGYYFAESMIKMFGCYRKQLEVVILFY